MKVEILGSLLVNKMHLCGLKKKKKKIGKKGEVLYDLVCESISASSH